MKRRTFLKGTMASSMLGVAVSAGLLAPRAVLAAWPESSFKAKKVDDALDALYGTVATKIRLILRSRHQILQKMAPLFQ